MVGIEYHKRFDDRSLMARRKYREGLFGEFRLGTACLLEKWYYRHSNFQNWMTTENSDAFTYIGCHYVDLVHFITGLLPVSVSVYGIRDQYPNGKEGFLWTDARVIWINGACLNVQNALGFPDAAPGTNTQGLTMYCRGEDGRHADLALRPISRAEVFLHRNAATIPAPPCMPSRARTTSSMWIWAAGIDPGRLWLPLGGVYRRDLHARGGGAGGLAERQALLEEFDRRGSHGDAGQQRL